MKSAWARHALCGALGLAGCAAAPHAASPSAAAAPPSASAVTSVPTAAVTPAVSATSANRGQQAEAPAPRSCGDLECMAFATPEAAFDYVLGSKPRVLAVGEAHAQEGTPGIRSSTRRFAEQLLPKLAGRSKHLVIELLLANCARPTVQGVKKQQAAVTEQQAKSNQNEFVTLGKVAQRLGMEPQGLTPDCAEYEAVLAAGENGVARLLTLVAQQTTKEVEALLPKTDSSSEPILSYGGALHNDLYPRPGQEAWSFGPQLAADTGNRYVELDLIVPEFVKDTQAWRNLPWFSAFDRDRLSNETLLYRPAPHSFVLIFPKTERAPAAPVVR